MPPNVESYDRRAVDTPGIYHSCEIFAVFGVSKSITLFVSAKRSGHTFVVGKQVRFGKQKTYRPGSFLQYLTNYALNSP